MPISPIALQVPPIVLQAGGALFAFLVVSVAYLLVIVWTYSDARQNSEHPAFLWTLVVFFAPILGILLYFLLGRERQYSERTPEQADRSESGDSKRPPL